VDYASVFEEDSGDEMGGGGNTGTNGDLGNDGGDNSYDNGNGGHGCGQICLSAVVLCTSLKRASKNKELAIETTVKNTRQRLNY
jgi:hypothetical protein